MQQLRALIPANVTDNMLESMLKACGVFEWGFKMNGLGSFRIHNHKLQIDSVMTIQNAYLIEAPKKGGRLITTNALPGSNVAHVIHMIASFFKGYKMDGDGQWHDFTSGSFIEHVEQKMPSEEEMDKMLSDLKESLRNRRVYDK